jgi:hypothetical protein
MVESLKDASHLYEVERRKTHAARDGFRINELTISTSQKISLALPYQNNGYFLRS